MPPADGRRRLSSFCNRPDISQTPTQEICGKRVSVGGGNNKLKIHHHHFPVYKLGMTGQDDGD